MLREEQRIDNDEGGGQSPSQVDDHLHSDGIHDGEPVSLVSDVDPEGGSRPGKSANGKSALTSVFAERIMKLTVDSTSSPFPTLPSLLSSPMGSEASIPIDSSTPKSKVSFSFGNRSPIGLGVAQREPCTTNPAALTGSQLLDQFLARTNSHKADGLSPPPGTVPVKQIPQKENEEEDVDSTAQSLEEARRDTERLAKLSSDISPVLSSPKGADFLLPAFLQAPSVRRHTSETLKSPEELSPRLPITSRTTNEISPTPSPGRSISRDLSQPPKAFTLLHRQMSKPETVLSQSKAVYDTISISDSSFTSRISVPPLPERPCTPENRSVSTSMLSSSPVRTVASPHLREISPRKLLRDLSRSMSSPGSKKSFSRSVSVSQDTEFPPLLVIKNNASKAEPDPAAVNVPVKLARATTVSDILRQLELLRSEIDITKNDIKSLDDMIRNMDPVDTPVAASITVAPGVPVKKITTNTTRITIPTQSTDAILAKRLHPLLKLIVVLFCLFTVVLCMQHRSIKILRSHHYGPEIALSLGRLEF
ncbi:uncharacterized protein V1518DRAFT_416798 [Limtongia smithiae]|uniref:uncharacterized protein n=1 Tax=Limtongia smithiae TaxID=1125753 RepID=UPI0034CEA4CB